MGHRLTSVIDEQPLPSCVAQPQGGLQMAGPLAIVFAKLSVPVAVGMRIAVFDHISRSVTEGLWEDLMSSLLAFTGQETPGFRPVAAFGHGAPTPQVIAAGIDEEPVTTIPCALAYAGQARGGQ